MTEQIAFLMGHRYVCICGKLVMYDEPTVAYMRWQGKLRNEPDRIAADGSTCFEDHYPLAE